MAHAFIEHLKKDHEKQRKLGEQLRNAKDPERRKELRQKMQEELHPHIEGEEASIFDYMQEAGGEAREEALKALQEHHVDRVLLRELMDLTLDGETFSAKAYVLDEINRHHIDEEEETHFPMLMRLASEEKLDELYEAYEEAEEQAKSE
ncbi:MAG: hemerythrin domain-containing protein [Anaerolineales bacterium]